MSASDFGINCRASLGYVTDGTDEVYLKGDDDYPVTRADGTAANHTYGWTARSSATHADRNNALDRRLAGAIVANNGTDTVRIDLPSAGTYDIYLASGDPSFSFSNNKIILKDNSTTKLTIGPHTTGSSEHFWDASDTERTSAANWVSNNVKATITFSSAILNIVFGDGSNYGYLNHIRIATSAGGGTVGTPAMAILLSQQGSL